MAISPPAPLAGAPLSRRLADTQSSPVRELLEIAMRPEIISLAGGLPGAGHVRRARPARGVRRGAERAGRDPRAAVLDAPRATRRLRARLAAFMSTRGLEVDRGRPADHDRLPAGARAWSRPRC